MNQQQYFQFVNQNSQQPSNNTSNNHASANNGLGGGGGASGINANSGTNAAGPPTSSSSQARQYNMDRQQQYKFPQLSPHQPQHHVQFHHHHPSVHHASSTASSNNNTTTTTPNPFVASAYSSTTASNPQQPSSIQAYHLNPNAYAQASQQQQQQQPEFHQYRPPQQQQQQQQFLSHGASIQTTSSPPHGKYEFATYPTDYSQQQQSLQPQVQQSLSVSPSDPASVKKGKKKSSIACELCRKHHRKCDGNQPCKNCNDKGVECIYTKRKKRGPKNDAAKKMREELEFLKRENASLKISENEWKQKYLQLLEQTSQSMFNSNGKRRRLEHDDLQSSHSSLSTGGGVLRGGGGSVSSDMHNNNSNNNNNNNNNNNESSGGGNSGGGEQFLSQTMSVLTSEIAKSPTERQQQLREEQERRRAEEPAPDKNERFYLVTIVSQFVEIYDTFVHPDHSLLPNKASNYSGVIPDLLSDMVQDNPRTPETNFFMYALLCNSACCIGNLELSREFFQMARMYAGDTFDVIDYRVGCGFVLMSYYTLCQADMESSLHYISIAKLIAEDGLKAYRSDLHQNALLGTAYAIMDDYDRRLQLFKEIGKGNKIGDHIFSLVGQVETELMHNANPNWTPMIDMLMQAYNLQKNNGADDTSPNTILHRVLTFGGLTKTLKKAKLSDMALHYAQELLKLTDDKNFMYCCVGVSSAALEAVADVLLDHGLQSDFGRVLFLIDKLSQRYKLCEQVKESIMSKYHDKYPNSEPTIVPPPPSLVLLVNNNNNNTNSGGSSGASSRDRSPHEELGHSEHRFTTSSNSNNNSSSGGSSSNELTIPKQEVVIVDSKPSPDMILPAIQQHKLPTSFHQQQQQ